MLCSRLPAHRRTSAGWLRPPLSSTNHRHLRICLSDAVLVCRDADSSPDQVVALQGACEAIVEGKEILDLPRLPPGGRRDCCFALILPQDKFLLLLADNPNDCRCVEGGGVLSDVLVLRGGRLSIAGLLLT
uniref:Uncharacterized protein n=1 Tax=Scleropages formosus TaxID=113540 RepID=A0A8C9R9I1_SCLFO